MKEKPIFVSAEEQQELSARISDMFEESKISIDQGSALLFFMAIREVVENSEDKTLCLMHLMDKLMRVFHSIL